MAEHQISETVRKAVQARSDAYVRYQKARLEYAEAHAKLVNESVAAGITNLPDYR